ncbi:hypothetical protein Btru_017616 [Bulinus truncatus]|nr:hypothetical protein Btru_017616 [Bulinus truncatus]
MLPPPPPYDGSLRLCRHHKREKKNTVATDKNFEQTLVCDWSRMLILMHQALITLILLCTSSKPTLQVTSHLGQTFYIQFPHFYWKADTESGVSLFLSTNSEFSFEVQMLTPAYKNILVRSRKSEEVLISLIPHKVVKYEVPKEYLINDVYEKATKSFQFNGISPFSISVLIRQDASSMGSFLACPVNAWGTFYSLVSLRFLFAFLIMTKDKSSVKVDYRLNSTSGLNWGGAIVKLKKIIQSDFVNPRGTSVWTGMQGDARVYSTCHEGVHMDFGNLTGTHVREETDSSFGVIVSNCVGKTESVMCDDISRISTEPSAKGDIAIEMLLPSESFGTDFITITTEARTSPGVMVIVSDESYVDVRVYTSQSDFDIYTIVGASDAVYIDSRPGPRRIRSMARLQVTYLQRSPCIGDYPELGDGSISLLVPTEYFYRDYYWGTPTNDAIQNFVIIVVPTTHRNSLVMNDERVDPLSITWQTVLGLSTWRVGEQQVLRELNHLTILKERAFFGCYVYGVGPGVGYMHQAGYMKRECVRTSSQSPGDGLDNDCDLNVDEEKSNNVDDDGDGEVDEDVDDFPHFDLLGLEDGWTYPNGSSNETHIHREDENPSLIVQGEKFVINSWRTLEKYVFFVTTGTMALATVTAVVLVGLIKIKLTLAKPRRR